MYGYEIILIVGVILFIINIVMIVKFFQIARNIERLTNLYVDGCKQMDDNSNQEYYKLPLEIDVEKTERIQQKEKERQEKINKMTVYYAGK